MRTISRIALALLPLMLALAPLRASAYPEMVRHHYVNCNACHVNPNGGGLLTEYGRGMSGEVLSTWHYENESAFLHGAINPESMPKFLNVGGDIRAVQLHHSNQQVVEGRYILMQTALETGLTAGPLTAVGSFFEPNAQNHLHAGLERFYLLGTASETLQFKAGRYLPAFGINAPQHILTTRQNLGFGYGSERDAVEAQYSGEKWHGAVGVSQSRINSSVGQRERAANLQLEKFFLDSYRVGFSLWHGESPIQKRWLYGVHGIFGFTEHLYLLSEITWQSMRSLTTVNAPYTTGIFQFNRFGYEVLKGLHLVALEDLAKTAINVPGSLTVQYGLGSNWYPRPHFEFEVAWTKRKLMQQGNYFEDYAYLMLHYYL
jgi:hypothetical protein